MKMKEMKHVKGKKAGKILLYALSICPWCAKTKRLLDKMGIDYHYIYVDLLNGAKKEKVEKEVRRWNPRVSFPTLVINSDICIVGHQEEEIGKLYEKLNSEAESAGYHLNPDIEFTKALVKGLADKRAEIWLLGVPVQAGGEQ